MSKSVLLFQRNEAGLNSREIMLLRAHFNGEDIVYTTAPSATSGAHHLWCRQNKPALVLCPKRTLTSSGQLPFELTAGSRIIAPHMRVNFETLEPFLEDYPSASSFARSKAA